MEKAKLFQVNTETDSIVKDKPEKGIARLKTNAYSASKIMIGISMAHSRGLDKNSLPFIFILVLLGVAGLVGSDTYLAFLPTMGEDLKTDGKGMQLTLSIFLLGLALGQLILGQLSDRWGRKHLMIAGMLLYFASSLCCAVSQTYVQFLLFRFLQAFGACTGLVLGRAVVADIFEKEDTARIFAIIFPFVGLSPAISPIIGAFVGSYLGWRAIFFGIAAFALTLAFLVVRFIPETLPEPLRTREKTSIFRTYLALLKDRKFIGYVSTPCFAYIAYFGYIAQAPFVFKSHGFSEREIGFVFITISLSYLIGNFSGRHQLKKSALNAVIARGYKIAIVGALLTLPAAYLPLPFSLLMLVTGISVLTFGNGMLIPLGAAAVLNSFANLKGLASGLMGFAQLSAATLSVAMIGTLSQNDIARLSLFFVATMLCGGIVFFMMVQKLQPCKQPVKV